MSQWLAHDKFDLIITTATWIW